ncbi:uncharacterized protein [Amphiura filiformis]|uniref:uncharacterized protein n=1 Tax=Amphiura filiformis TaxID=82378 RepID=UPI003B223470
MASASKTINNISWAGDVKEHFTELETRQTKKNIDKSLQFLSTCSDYSSKESEESVEFLRKVSRLLSIRHIYGDYLAEQGFAGLFAKMWKAYLGQFKTLTDPIVNKMGFLTRAVMASPKLCAAMGKSGSLTLLLHQLRAPNITVDQLNNEDTFNYVLLVILIIQSAMHLCSDNREVYRQAGAVAVLTPYVQRLQSTEKELNKRLIKLGALLTLSYILNESETKRLDSADVKLCATFLGLIHSKDATIHKSMANTGVSKTMILDGVNHVALLNDENKVNFVQAGMVPLLTKVLKNKEKFTEEERVLAARGLWTLSFVGENRDVLKKDADVIKSLKENSTSSSEGLRSTCNSALWEIYEGEVGFLDIRKQNATKDAKKDTKTSKSTPSLLEVVAQSTEDEPEDGQPGGQHGKERDGQLGQESSIDTCRPIKVMISYQWDVQENMVKLKENLSRTNLFSVWMDVDKMKGSILAGMADAVEESDVILVCLSRKYKESLNCRTEASYAYKLKKPLVPLLVEDNYNPDGWLGALVGMELYYKFHQQDQITSELPGLINAVQDKCSQELKEGLGLRPSGVSVVSRAEQKLPKAESSNVIPVSLSSLAATGNTVSAWSTERVAEWLDNNDLSDLKMKFQRLRGKHLHQLYKRYQRSPDVFDSTLKNDLQMDFITIVMLTTALEELFTL